MARTHTFKGSASAGYGYFAYIEDGQLVIGEDWGREGGILFRGTYEEAKKQGWLNEIWRQRSKLSYSIEEYYTREAKKVSKAPTSDGYVYDDVNTYFLLEELKEEGTKVKVSDAPAKEETITHNFKDSRDSYGNGYSGYLDENYDLVLVYNVSCYHDIYYRGPYATAGHQLGELRSRDKVLYDDIEKYFIKHGISDESDRKDLGGSKETKYTVRLFLNNSKEIVAVIPGTSETDVIKKIMLPVPDTVMMYDLEGRTIAVRSDKIYTVTILD